MHDNTYNGKEEHINEYKEKNNFIIKKNKSYVDDFHTSTFDIFSDENLNLFMHTYKNIYVLNNMENIITCNEKNKKINYEYKQNEYLLSRRVFFFFHPPFYFHIDFVDSF